ncbi:hypothetical protein [Kitasatospora griseola]|uniref:hypothetical protein n=1 Tax=Kitasatospora griseola TaxID=2064 RepID=UPI00341737A5
MTASTLVAQWKNPEARADESAPHPAGEIDPTLRCAELPRVRRALVLSGWAAPDLGTIDIDTNDTTTWNTVTSLSFTED